MNALKTITPLVWRVIVFVCLFVIASGILGPRIISGGILFRDGFALYGGIGKAVLFGLIAFLLLVRHNKAHVVLRLWRPASLGWILISFVMFVIAWKSVDNLLAGHRGVLTLIMAHGSLLLCLLLALIGCIGLKNIQLIWRRYKREVVISFIICALFYLFLLVVYALWQPLASVVLLGVNELLGYTHIYATVMPPHTLLLDKFGITIAEYCSGIESIALFTGLYAIVGLLDWERIHKQRYLILFPCALFILCLLNIIRVYGLIVAGYYINPEIAFSLFHTYAGMIFFILYSAIFWSISYKYLLKKERAHSHGISS